MRAEVALSRRLQVSRRTPSDLSNVQRDIDALMNINEMHRAKLAARMTWEINANWKLVVENFGECYHCGPAHPEYCAVMESALPGTTGAAAHKQSYAEQVERWNIRAQALGHPVGQLRTSDRYIHAVERYPIGQGRMSQAKDGRAVAPVMGKFVENDGGITSARIHPGCYWINACDHAVTFRFTPISAVKTI